MQQLNALLLLQDTASSVYKTIGLFKKQMVKIISDNNH